MKTIKEKFEELKNDPEKAQSFQLYNIKPSISVYIPYKKESKWWYSKKILEQDKSKWFVEYDDMQEYFFNFFRNGEKPDYDGVYFVSCMHEDWTYHKNDLENRHVSVDRIRRNYLSKKYYEEFKDDIGFEQPITFNVKCTMKRRWADEFASFLKCLEDNGNVGHSSEISFFADGDGDFRPKFEIDNKDIVNDLQPIVLDKNDGPAECLFDAG